MFMRLIIVGLLILSSIFCSGSSAADAPKKITCSGKVVDDANKPVAGAKVTLYQLMPDVGGQELKKATTEEQITKEDGSFSFSAETLPDKQYQFAILIARKGGLAIGWDNWDIRKDKTTELAMSKPYTLRGIVVDDADKPVAGAEVRISMLLSGDPKGGPEKFRYLVSIEPLDILVTDTDAGGIFVFNNIPAEAKAEFIVKKAGMASINTFKPPQSLNSASEYNPGQYTVESKDIRIVQPIGARIEGKVVEKGTGKPVGGVRLICTGQNPGGTFGVKPVVSKDDGTFSFDGLEAKTYTIRDVPSREKIAQWVIKPATVTTAAGQTSSGIILEASKGGMLEVTIRDNEKKPVAGASVYARMNNNDKQGASGISNSDGIAAIRLTPGEYVLQVAYKEGYSSLRKQQNVTVEDGKTTRLEIELKANPRITGVVRDPNGRPVAGATLRICPMGPKETTSDKEGKFEISWNPEQRGTQESQLVLVARHLGQNLAAAVDIEEDTRTFDVNMSPGIEFSGKVVDPNGKPIAGARVGVSLRVSNYGASFDNDVVVTDQDGRYEYKAIPEGQKYSVSARADGYGESSTMVDADDADNNRLEISPLILKEATFSISGIVVDVNDKPIANTEVSVNGQGQQYRRGTTDAQGKFIIDKLCEGQVQVSANVRSIGSGSIPMYGNVSAKAGDTDVKVVVGPPMPDMANQPSGMLEVVITDDANEVVAGANVSVRKKDGNRWQNGVSDENGIASLKLLPGEYSIAEVRKEGYSSPRERQTVTIEVGKTARLEIELKANPSITGVVRDPNGQPVARAAMRVFPWGQKETNSDKEGKFKISWNPGQRSDQEIQPVLIVRHIRRNLAAAVDIDEDTKTFDVNMLPGVVFTGAVVDPNDKLIAGAKINVTLSISGHGMDIGTADVRTDHEGKYEVKTIPSGQQYTVSARAEGYYPGYVKVDADDAVDNRLEIPLLKLKTADMSIAGIVVDVNGNPVANARVFVIEDGQQSPDRRTDEQGRFTIDKLCAGQVYIDARAKDGQAELYGNTNVSAGDTDVKVVVGSPGRAEEMADMANQPSGTLEVVVTDDTNEAVAGANVSVREKDGNRWKNSISDENGIASLKLPPGEYYLAETRKEGYLSPRERQTVTVEDGKTTRLEIELKANPRITGVVRDPNGQPVARAAMRVFPRGQKETYSDKDGKFEISLNPEQRGGQGLEPVLVVRHIRRNLAAAVDIDENTKILDVNMSPGIVFTGVVVDPNDELIAGAKINVTLGILGYGMIDNTDVTTDQDGQYEVKTVPAGRQYIVSARADGYGQSYAGADAEDAVGNHLEIKPLTLKAADMNISGIVVDINDKPMANAEVYINGQDQQSRRSITDANGKFTIDKLCEGKVQVSANVSNGQTYVRGDVFASAGDTDVTVVVAPLNAARQTLNKIDSEQFEQAKKTLSTSAQCANKEELEAEIDKAKTVVDNYGGGHVIIGRVVLDGQGDVRYVAAQMEILADGYFAGETKDFIGPVGFRMHGYAPYDLKLKGMEGSLVDVGTIHMTSLKEEQLASLKAAVSLEENGDSSQAFLYFRVADGPKNSLYGGNSPRKYWPQSIVIHANGNGLIEASGFSPVSYWCRVAAPGYLEKPYTVEFKEGQTLDLGTITLETPRQIQLSYIVSEEPPFDLNNLQNASIPAGTKWKALDNEECYGWDLEFAQDKGSIIMRCYYAPCYLRDLGEGEITEYANVDKKKIGQDQPQNLKAKNEHVYLLHQEAWKRWVLFKIVTQ